MYIIIDKIKKFLTILNPSEDESKELSFIRMQMTRALWKTFWQFLTKSSLSMQQSFCFSFYIAVLRFHLNLYFLQYIKYTCIHPPPSSSLILSSHQSWNNFNLQTYIHSICTTFAVLHPLLTSLPLPLVPTPKIGPVPFPCSSIL
jgi:hypothetical protein